MPGNPDCRLCPLYADASHVCLWGDGPHVAEGMIVGQSPGEEEDAQGRVFVGRSGHLLDDLLEQAGINRYEVYVTNANKCHPAGNREQTEAERKACRGYLIEEVRSVAPRIILALGNPALKSLTNRGGITKQRSKLLALHKDFDSPALVIATYHPAATFRAPKYKVGLIDDMMYFRRILVARYTKIPVEYEVATRALLPEGPGPVVFDIETFGFDPRLPGFRLLCVGAYGGAGKAVIWPGEYLKEAMASLKACERGRGLAAWNAKFDAGVLGLLTGEELRYDDPMLMAYALREDGRHDLKSLATVRLGVEPWEHGMRDKIAAGDVGHDGELYRYCATDCVYTYHLLIQLREQLVNAH